MARQTYTNRGANRTCGKTFQHRVFRQPLEIRPARLQGIRFLGGSHLREHVSVADAENGPAQGRAVLDGAETEHAGVGLGIAFILRRRRRPGEILDHEKIVPARQSKSGPMSVRPPNRCATRISFVAGVTACCHCSTVGAIRCVSRSTGTGTSPWCSMILIMSGIVIAETSTCCRAGIERGQQEIESAAHGETRQRIADGRPERFNPARDRSPVWGERKHDRPQTEGPTSRCPVSFLDHTVQFFNGRKRVSVNSPSSRALVGSKYNGWRQFSSIVTFFRFSAIPFVRMPCEFRRSCVRINSRPLLTLGRRMSPTRC